MYSLILYSCVKFKEKKWFFQNLFDICVFTEFPRQNTVYFEVRGKNWYQIWTSRIKPHIRSFLFIIKVSRTPQNNDFDLISLYLVSVIEFVEKGFVSNQNIFFQNFSFLATRRQIKCWKRILHDILIWIIPSFFLLSF